MKKLRLREVNKLVPVTQLSDRAKVQTPCPFQLWWDWWQLWCAHKLEYFSGHKSNTVQVRMNLFRGDGALLQLVMVEEGSRALGCSWQGRLSRCRRGSSDMPPRDSLLHSPHFLSPHLQNGCFLFFFPFHVITTTPHPPQENIITSSRRLPGKPLRCWPHLWVRFLSHAPVWEPACFWALSHREAFAISPHIWIDPEEMCSWYRNNSSQWIQPRDQASVVTMGFWVGPGPSCILRQELFSNDTLLAASFASQWF